VPQPRPHLAAPDLRFEPFAERWLDAVAELVKDPEVLRFTRVPEPVPPDFARTWLGMYDRGREDGTREAFAAVGAGETFLGLALAPTIDRVGGEIELGYVVAPDARGHGVATTILSRLTRWAFQELRAERIYLIIDVENPPSARVASRCGYRLEGVMRQIHLKAGRRVDAGLWSRLPADPEPFTDVAYNDSRTHSG
jgi:RimJ/RimL family protein N-acetyltransferase